MDNRGGAGGRAPIVPRMPHTIALLAAAAVLLLAGCVPLPPALPGHAAPASSPAGEAPQPEPSADELLRQEAELNYKIFLLALNALARHDRVDPDDLRGATTEAFAADVAASFNTMREQGVRFDGVPTVTQFVLLTPIDPAVPVALVCSDVREMQMIDVATGEASELDASAFEEMYVAFVRSDTGYLLIDGRAPVPVEDRVCP